MLSVAILVIPVSLQIFSRYTALIPSYIWTEEMARFLFIWTIMIGAMIGVRESTHFEVDVWPQLSRRGEAVVRLAGRLGVLVAALVFVWAGIEFTKFAWNRTSELAELPLWLIHVAWPVTGADLDRLPRRAGARRPQDHLREIGMTGAVLSPGMAALILFGLFFLFMFLRVPVAFALALACLPILVIEPRLDTMTLMQETFNAYNSFILLAVPFFLLTANLMNVGGTTDRLMTLSRTMVGHFPGGLAQINVVLSIFFAGISGSSTADAASQSKIFIEAQTKEGYDLSFSVAITAVSAVLAVIIPPSILMIVWGGILTVSIGALFLAGIVPGLLIGFAQMATVHAYAKARGYPTYPRSTWREFLCASWIAIPALMTPGIIIGGKIFGWFTATESACVAVLYAAVLSLFVYREMDMKGLYSALARHRQARRHRAVLRRHRQHLRLAARLLQDSRGDPDGRVGLGHGLYRHRVLRRLRCSWWSAAFSTPFPAIIICAPILEPLAKAVHMDPVHFAMIGIVSLAFGLVTPPYGLCLMIACSIAGMRIRDAIKDTMIMLIPMLVVLALVIIWPKVSLFLPNLISPEFLR